MEGHSHTWTHLDGDEAMLQVRVLTAMGRWDRNKEVDLVPAVHLGQEEVKKQDWGRRRRRKEKMGRWRKREK